MSQLVTYNGIVGYVLEQRRQELGYDQGQVAQAVGISQPVLSRLEKGKAAITIDQLFALSKALKIEPMMVVEKTQAYVATFEQNNGVQVTTSKQSDSIEKSGVQGSSVLAGAAIGAVLALLLSKK
jgi:predicted transcriptional regulator